MRMVTRAAGVNSTIVPRLPYQFGYAATPSHGVPSHPSNFSSAKFSSQSAFPDVEAGTSGHAEIESPLERSLSANSTPTLDLHGDNVAFIRSRKRTPIIDRHDLSQRPISDQNHLDIATETKPPSSPVFGPVNVSLDNRKLRIASQPQNRESAEREPPESAVDESQPEGIEQNATNVAPAIGKATRSLASDPAATLPGANRLSVATSRQRTSPPEPETVEVKIGRVEVTFDNPAPPVSGRPAPPRGFDAYTALRRYSPQAWNRWTRNR